MCVGVVTLRVNAQGSGGDHQQLKCCVDNHYDYIAKGSANNCHNIIQADNWAKLKVAVNTLTDVKRLSYVMTDLC